MMFAVSSQANRRRDAAESPPRTPSILSCFASWLSSARRRFWPGGVLGLLCKNARNVVMPKRYTDWASNALIKPTHLRIIFEPQG